MKKLVLGLVLLGLPVAAFSVSLECEKCISEDIPLAECYGDEYDRQDKRLNVAYKAAIKSNNMDVKLLKQKQRDWIKLRDKSCPEPNEDTRSASDYARWQYCLADKTEVRAVELEQIARFK